MVITYQVQCLTPSLVLKFYVKLVMGMKEQSMESYLKYESNIYCIHWMTLRLDTRLNAMTIYTLQSIQNKLEQTAQETVGKYDTWSLGQSIYQHTLTVQTISICAEYDIIIGMLGRKGSPGSVLEELWSHLPQRQVEIEVSCSWDCTEG